MAKKKEPKEQKPKGTNGYVAKLNSAIRKQLGLAPREDIPANLKVLVTKTAMDMLVLDQITEEMGEGKLTTIEVGSMGQQKTVVNPLVPYFEKYSARVTDDLYNLGLTARKQAAKGEDQADRKAADQMQGYMEATINQ